MDFPNAMGAPALTQWEAALWRTLAAAVIFTAGLVYIRGWRRLQGFHKTQPPKDAPASGRSLVLFMAGLALLAGALISPLGHLSTQYFSARIVQHMLLVASVPSLLMMANPVPALVYGLPGQWRVGLLARQTAAERPGRTRRFIRWATAPGVTLLLFLCVCWFWYDPGIHAATLRYSVLHAVELASLLAAGLLNWWHITAAWPRAHGHMEPIVRIGYAFISVWPIKLVGMALMFAGESLYEYPSSFRFSGLQIDDVQFGAIIAWIVSGLAYAVAAVNLTSEWLAREVEKPALPEANWATDENMLAPGIKH